MKRKKPEPKSRLLPPSLGRTPGAPVPGETPTERKLREERNVDIAREKERRRKLSNSVH